MERLGCLVFDQKPDDFIYSVMVQSCKDWNKPLPVILDLTGESIGSYAPFEHGLLRERLQRFNKVLVYPIQELQQIIISKSTAR